MRSILSALFKVSAIKPQALNRFSGLSIRSLLYNRVLEGIADARVIHEYKGLKPLSSTPIFKVVNNNYRILGIGDKLDYGYFRLSFLNIDDFYRVIEYLVDMNEFLIDGILVKVDNIQFNTITYKNLLRDTKKISGFTIHFISPTMFRSSRYYVKVLKSGEKYVAKAVKKSGDKLIYKPYPDPSLMFRSIIRQIRKFGGNINYPFNEIIDYIENDGVAVSGFSKGIVTKAIKLSPKEHYVGFIGKVSFIVNQSEVSKYIYPLLKFAEYSNVGAARTAGFGWIKISNII